MKRRRNKNKNKEKLILISFVVFSSLITILLIVLLYQTDKAIGDLVRGQSLIQKQVWLQLDQYKPLRRWQVENVDIQAKSALSISIDKNYQNKKILFEKDPDKKLGIASITKLMTALVALQKMNLDQRIQFNQEDVDTIGEIGYFKPGETFLLKDLIYSLLGESSNDAATAISRTLDKENFVLDMNIEANNLGLENTLFVDPTGLTENDGQFNYSTADDLAKLITFILKNQDKSEVAKLILKATGTKEFELFTVNGVFHHKILNSNKLLYKYSDIISGKTGWTPLAQGCLVVVLKSPSQKGGYIINVILGSPQRFNDMENLIEWDKKAYYW